jgi:hypothetical protein
MKLIITDVVYILKPKPMKRSLFMAIFFLALISQLIQAQENQVKEKKNAVKLNLISPFVKTFNLAYERVLNENLGLQIRGYYTGYSDKGTDPETKTTGFGIIPELRLYLSEKKKAPAGFFVAPFIRFDKFDVTENYEDGSTIEGTYSDIGAGLLIGHQSVFSNIVTLEAFIGPQYIFGKEEGDIEGQRLKGVLPRGGVTIGILF